MYPHGPARAILSQPTLPRLRPFGRGSRRDPQPEGAPLSLQALRGRTFSETQGSALYRVHKPKWLVLAVVTLLAYGCPVQAIVAAFGLEMSAPSPAGKRNAACDAGEYMSTSSRPPRWRFCRRRLTRSGSRRSARSTGRPPLWRSEAGCGSAGLCESPSRRPTDPYFTTASVRLWAAGEDLGGDRRATDGLASYKKSQALKVFRKPLHTGKVGPPRLVLCPLE